MAHVHVAIYKAFFNFTFQETLTLLKMRASNTELELFFLTFKSHKIKISVTYFFVLQAITMMLHGVKFCKHEKHRVVH